MIIIIIISLTIIMIIIVIISCGKDISLEWKLVVDRRRFTSGNRTVGREEEDRNNHMRTKTTDFMRNRNVGFIFVYHGSEAIG